MTYCLGIITRSGLIMAADSRTNAGVDYVSSAQKLFDLSIPHERILLICTSGNLSMTQSILMQIRRGIKEQHPGNIYELQSMHDVVTYIGTQTRKVLDDNFEWMKRDKIELACNFLVGGQIKGEPPELYMVYAQGNFLRATKETPYLQIGEIKYGKPILDRAINFENTSLEEAAKCALLSIDSTMKSNISVGPPINLVQYETNRLLISQRRQFKEGDPYLAKIRTSWEKSLRKAFNSLPSMPWDNIEENEAESKDNWLLPTNIYPQ